MAAPQIFIRFHTAAAVRSNFRKGKHKMSKRPSDNEYFWNRRSRVYDDQVWKVYKKAYKKTVSIVDESTIALYESLGREKKGFLMESNDKENGRYTFMGVEPEALIQSDGESLVITKADGTKEVRRATRWSG